MITINDKSSRTPIFIERDILNKNEKPSNDYVNSDELDEILSGYITDDELNNKGYITEIPSEYVTEDELQEILKEYNTVPYLYILQSGEMVGDFDAVYDAVKNKKPYLLYVYSFNNTIFFNSLAESVEINGDKIECSDDVITTIDGEPKLYSKVLSIGKDGVTVLSYLEKILPTEFKTINGNEITGTGDIVVEGGNGNIVELTQSEYNNIIPEEDTLYVITDAPAVEIPDTSNFVDKETLNYEIDAINISLSQKQDTLVSGVNIKTINGNEITGTGDIVIEGGNGNIVELTQSEYNAIIPDSDTLYLISDSSINTTLKTINGESIIGEGDIKIDVDLTGYAKLSYVDEQIGDINSVLENIIG